jgi:hypothetical protein
LRIPSALVVARSNSQGIFVFKITMEKKCNKCGEVKSLDEFCNKKDCKDGKALRCKSCAKDYIKNVRENKPQNIGTLEFINLFEKNHGLKKCIICEVLKSLDQFTSKKDSKDGKRNECKDCNKLYRLENKEYLKDYSKKYRLENKEYLKDYSKKYSLENKDRNNAYLTNRRRLDDTFKLRVTIRNRISESIRYQGYSKNTKTYNILKCEYHFFKEWINGVASNGYTYGIGDLHLDHVIPISLAETEDEILLLSHYSNYQLLNATDNMSKGNRRVNPLNLARVLEHNPNPDKIREIHARL